jgi:hypothetical protein
MNNHEDRLTQVEDDNEILLEAINLVILSMKAGMKKTAILLGWNIALTVAVLLLMFT